MKEIYEDSDKNTNINVKEKLVRTTISIFMGLYHESIISFSWNKKSSKKWKKFSSIF
jgi:hypothetical protein